MERLGVDIGGVLIARVDPRSDTSFFGDNYLETPAVPGAIEALRRLSTSRFGGRVFLVLKCGAGTEQRTRAWLSHHRVFARAGLSPERLHFCRERADKAPICRDLGITHFIDDRLEILSYLESVPHRFLFDGTADEVAQHVRHLPAVTRVQGWAEAQGHLLYEG